MPAESRLARCRLPCPPASLQAGVVRQLAVHVHALTCTGLRERLDTVSGDPRDILTEDALAIYTAEAKRDVAQRSGAFTSVPTARMFKPGWKAIPTSSGFWSGDRPGARQILWTGVSGRGGSDVMFTESAAQGYFNAFALPARCGAAIGLSGTWSRCRGVRLAEDQVGLDRQPLCRRPGP